MNTFNFNRLALLLKRYFTENMQREITYWAIITLVFVFIHQADAVRIILYISGLIFAAHQFKIFGTTSGGMHYLLIPATHTEKLTASILISTVYYFIMIVITYLIGYYLGTTLGNTFFNLELPYEYGFIHGSSFTPGIPDALRTFTDNSLLSTFGSFTLIQALFILGSLYFKRNPAFKTMLIGFLCGTIILTLQIILLRMLYGSFTFDSSFFPTMDFDPDNSKVINFASTIYIYGGYVATVFFWVVSYFRLTEKQV